MQFTDLPEEILIIIIQKLDVKSQYNLYNTCKLLRNVICMPGVLKQCQFAFNTMATVNSLQLDFFKDIANNLLELNLCGVADLCKTKLFPALKKLKRLKVLDVSYTEITISDLKPIHDSCPTIKDISINFVWDDGTDYTTILIPCRKVFENFENAKFIGPIENLIYSNLPFYLLKEAKLHKLKFVVMSVHSAMDCDELIGGSVFPEFDHFALDVLDWESKSALSTHWPESHILSMLQLKECEYIVMLAYAFKVKIYASPSFINFFKDVFNREVECTPLSEIDFSDPSSTLCYNTHVMIRVWNKATTTFDEKFYNDLSKHITKYVPYKLDPLLENEVPAGKKYGSYYISPIPYYTKNDEVIEDHIIKRKRVAIPNLVLNYDMLLKEEEEVELVVHFKHRLYNGVGLTDSCMYLRKLTYLSLINIGKYSSDFFKVLFECCVNLVTLNVQSPLFTSSALPISRSITLAKSLKNLRISEKFLDFETLFLSLAQCKSLENIHLCKSLGTIENMEYNPIGNPSLLVEPLDQLYNLYIETILSQSATRKVVKLFKKTKKMYNKHHIHFEVNSNYGKNYTFYPYGSVFKLSVITSV